ncbi:MAG: CheR family methyltransferase [bacterium]
MFFRHFNLKTSRFPFEEDFDVIFCRNVMIYFDETMIKHVIEQLFRSLKPGGLLFIGQTEHLSNISHSLEKLESSIFRRPKP